MKHALASVYAWVFARPGRFAQAVNHALYHLALRGMGFNNGWKPDKSGELWFVCNILRPYNILRPGHPLVCLDVGANVGTYTEMLIAETLASKVIAFEPLPKCAEILREKASLPWYAGRMEVVEAAVAEKVGEAELHYGDPTTEHASLSTSVGHIDYVGAGNMRTMQVSTTSLDDWFDLWTEKRPDARVVIDLIKIDVEGYEMEVLRGARRLIRDSRPKFVQIEWNLHQLMRGHTLRGVAALLPEYDCYVLLPHGMRRVDVSRPEYNTYCYANFVFVLGRL